MPQLGIQAVLAATVLVAGMFALMPVEKAVTVHTTIINSITSATVLADNSLTAAKIANDAITAAKIANDAIGATEIADNAIDAGAIAADAITAAKLATDSITNDELATSAATEIRDSINPTGTALVAISNTAQTTIVGAPGAGNERVGFITFFAAGGNADQVVVIGGTTIDKVKVDDNTQQTIVFRITGTQTVTSQASGSGSFAIAIFWDSTL